MKTEFTRDYIIANQGCYSETPGKVEALPFIDNDVITIKNLFDDLPIKDFTWFLAKKCDLTPLQSVALAVHCAEFSLKFFEEKHPEDKRPFNAIKAAKDYLNNPCSETANAAANAANAAYAAAYAAYAAAYAAYAAYAVNVANAAYAVNVANAAVNAAYAADAAAYAANAAYAADAADEYRTHIWKFVEQLTKQ